MKSPRASSRASGRTAPKRSATRRAASLRLRENEARLRLALEAAQVGIYDWDIPRRRITWSQSVEPLWGFTPGECRGTYQEFAERVHPEDLPLVSAEIARCRAARERYSGEFRVVWPDGTERWVLGRGEFSFRRDGAAVRMRGIVKDVTERRQTEQRLRESEEKFSKAFHASPAMIVISTRDGKNVDFNDAYAAFVGRPREQMLGKSSIELGIVDADERQKLIDLVRRGDGTMRSVDVAVRTSAGARVRFLMSSDRITLGGVPHQLSTMLDITDGQRAIESLKESELRYRELFETNPVAMFLSEVICDPEGRPVDCRFLSVNPAFERFVHAKAADLVGRTLFEFNPRTSREMMERQGRVALTGTPDTWEGLSVALDTCYEATVFSPRHGQCVTYLVDISDRKRAEAALQASTERLGFVIRGTETGLWDWDLSTNQVHYSHEWKQLLGYRDHEVADHLDEWRRLTHPEDVEPTLAKVTAFLQQPAGTFETEFRMRHASGEHRWILSRATAQLGTDGKPTHLLGLHVDITDSRRAGEELRNLSRRLMESQDTSRRDLARELHDRIGQNLTALSLNLSIIKAQIPADRPEAIPARLDDSLSLVAATMDRVRNLMAELRPPALDDYGLAAALRWYGKLFVERSGVAVRVTGSDPPLRLPPEIESALFRVAEEALTNVGRHAAAREVLISLVEIAGEVVLTIADDGRGFDPASLSGSASWGMASMRERAQAIGAQCEIHSVRGRGTTVTVRMPGPDED
jgi:PAS domain S-box-containing protein